MSTTTPPLFPVLHSIEHFTKNVYPCHVTSQPSYFSCTNFITCMLTSPWILLLIINVKNRIGLWWSKVTLASTKVIRWFCTAHLLLHMTRWPLWKRASKVTLLKWSWPKWNAIRISVAVVSCLDETQGVGNVHNIGSTIVAEFDFPTENLNDGHLTCAISLWFSFKSHLYHIAS